MKKREHGPLDAARAATTAEVGAPSRAMTNDVFPFLEKFEASCPLDKNI